MRLDGFGRGVEAARPAARCPTRRRRSRSRRPRSGPRRRARRGCRPSARGRRPFPVKPAGCASGLPSPRRQRVSSVSARRDRVHVGGELEAARSSASTSPLTRALQRGPLSSRRLVALLAVLGVPVEAPAERRSVRPRGARSTPGSRDQADLALGPAHVELARGRRPDPERAPAEEHAEHSPRRPPAPCGPRIETGRSGAVGGTSIASRAEPPSVSTSRSRSTSPLVPS